MSTSSDVSLDNPGADIGSTTTTDESDNNLPIARVHAGAPGVGRSPSEMSMPRKRGIEAPPFRVQNQEALDYLLAVYQAEAGAAIQSVELSEAVALQIRELVFSGTSGLTGNWACVYALLASIKLVQGGSVQGGSVQDGSVQDLSALRGVPPARARTPPQAVRGCAGQTAPGPNLRQPPPPPATAASHRRQPPLPYPILSYPILPYPTLPYPILSYPTLPYPILS